MVGSKQGSKEGFTKRIIAAASLATTASRWSRALCTSGIVVATIGSISRF